MKKLMVLSMLVLFVSFALSGIVFADCGACQVDSNEEGEVTNAVCPVMAGAVSKDTPYKTEHNGKMIGFCCPGCIDAFKKDPEKYMAKIERKCMIKCPKCKTDIDVIEECKKAGESCSISE
ncbi:YHS domain-containing protein [Candidatus Omnitrophota bacterium]